MKVSQLLQCMVVTAVKLYYTAGLTVENVVHHIKHTIGSRWKTLGKKLLPTALMNQITSLMLSDDEGIVAIIHAWLFEDGSHWSHNNLYSTPAQRTWRNLLMIMDEMGEMDLADKLMDLAEPMKGDDEHNL